MNMRCGLLLAMSLLASLPAIAEPTGRFAADFAAFAANDVTNPPPDNPVLFVGSSSFRLWTTMARDLAPAPVLNRGFGGSHAADALARFDDLITRYRPRQVFLYEGDNDIQAGKSPESVLADIVAFAERLAETIPGTPLVILTPKPCPSRWQLRDQYETLNRLLGEYAAKTENVDLVDTWKPMLDANGQPRPDLFVGDQLHMNADGYAIWTRLLRPLLLQSPSTAPTAELP